MPERLVNQLISEQSHKLQLIEAEIAKREREIQTPLKDAVISGLVAFSKDFAEHLEAVEQIFEGRRTVVDGLDVRAVVLRKGEEIWLKLSSILQPEGVLWTLHQAS
jgi:hypothetical protein